MREDYDIIIIGGGLAGGCLALAIEGGGFSVVVVEGQTDEQQRRSPAGDRGLALAYGSVQLLKRLGVWQGSKQFATPIRDIHISDRGHFGKTRLSAEKEGVEALGYVITARPLESQVSDGLKRASVDMIQPARLIGIKAGSESVCVTLAQGDSSNLHLNGRLVVGADGDDSSVRKLLDIGQTVRDYGQSAIVTTVKPERNPSFTAFERFTPQGPLALLPNENGCCSVIWTRSNDDLRIIMDMSKQEFVDELQTCFGYWLGHLSLCAPRQAFPLKLVQAQQMVTDRAALVGNAAHRLHPVAGQGFNLGLRDVARLAEMLIGLDPSAKDPGSPKLLQDFQAERMKDQLRVVTFTNSIISIFTNEWMPLALSRNLGLLSLDHLSGAKHVLSRYAMGLGGRLPRVGKAGSNEKNSVTS